MMKKRFLSVAVTCLMSIILIGGAGTTANAQELSAASLQDVQLVEESDFGQRLETMQEQDGQKSEEELSREYQLEVEKIGTELFPQYAQKNAMPRTRAFAMRSNELGEVTYSETKPVSDTEEMTYTEYASGRGSLAYHKSWTNTTTSAAYGGTVYNRTVLLTVTGCYGSIYVSHFQYLIVGNGGYDGILNKGTCTDNFGYTTATLQKGAENASGPAIASYAGNVSDMMYGLTVGVSFQIRVGGNAARVYVGNTEI